MVNIHPVVLEIEDLLEIISSFKSQEKILPIQIKNSILEFETFYFNHLKNVYEFVDFSREMSGIINILKYFEENDLPLGIEIFLKLEILLEKIQKFFIPSIPLKIETKTDNTCTWSIIGNRYYTECNQSLSLKQMLALKDAGMIFCIKCGKEIKDIGNINPAKF